MRRRFLGRLPMLLLVPLALASGGAVAAPPEIGRLWTSPRLTGEGRLRFLGMSVYDIRLWAPQPVSGQAWSQTPLALELVYARKLVGRLIAERSLDEMRRQGPIDDTRAQTWLAQMERLFPDVGAGDRLTGVMLPGEGARFFLNGQPRGEVRDPEFARRFFGIWLAPQTSEPGLRERLLGERS